MPRKRLIDTEEFYFDTEIVTLLKERGLHLYIRLWGLAEDWGGYEPKYDDIALKMGALKLKSREVEQYINKLIEKRKIIEYEKGGHKIHWLVNLLKHQPLDNPALPKLPLPEWITYEIKNYPSKKKYAIYTIISEKLPVGYRSATSRLAETQNSNVTNSNVTNSNVTEQKRKEITPFTSLFEEIYLKYPKRVGKKEAVRHFEASVKNEQDWQDIQTALKNYLASERVAKGFIQNASTWFNDWKTWIDYKEDLCSKCKGRGRYVSSTGYEITCDCPAGLKAR